jgi:integrase
MDARHPQPTERLIVKLAGTCGMRPGEIVGLQWQDLTTEGLRITRAIYRSIIQTPKTHHSVRTVAIGTTIREDFEDWRAIAPNNAPDDWVFPSENGKTPLWANNAWHDKIRPTLTKADLGWVNYQVLRLFMAPREKGLVQYGGAGWVGAVELLNLGRDLLQAAYE